jgi:hypothetical protein
VGGSTWIYFVPYEPDPKHALESLQQDVFRRDQYQPPPQQRKISAADRAALVRDLGEDKVRELERPFAGFKPEERARLVADMGEDQVAELEREGMRRSKRRRPASIAALRDACGEDGTHSILDMSQGISARPRLGAVSPMTMDELRAQFGTSEPTREQAQAWHDRGGIVDCRQRWEGAWFPVYRDGKAAELCFAGFSGD